MDLFFLGVRGRFFLLLSGCVASRQLKEDFFEGHGCRAELVEVPSAFDNGAGEVTADETPFLPFYFE